MDVTLTLSKLHTPTTPSLYGYKHTQTRIVNYISKRQSAFVNG